MIRGPSVRLGAERAQGSRKSVVLEATISLSLSAASEWPCDLRQEPNSLTCDTEVRKLTSTLFAFSGVAFETDC